MHSLCVNHKQKTRFVTVVFGINDDLKRSVGAPAFMEDLNLFGVSVAESLSRWGLENEALRFSGDASNCSLWGACLFPVCSDQQSSFSLTLEMLQAALSGSTFTLPRDTQLMSMQEALQCKDLQQMLEFRTGLYEDIKQRKPNN
ncbi:hypothetical protein CgunFtcFv8_027261 [Champsocephalus gunnari]|uniref:GDP-fucose pyrophosphorylase domain-containing protein n=1 Tax=Champsocephalus gunnari TaxID=52237 RepID=A0AAN8DXU8_CHAGU|nr:hypothetical protein CgunFtcFv8_027261 [Champsocephalus gunnari]